MQKNKTEYPRIRYSIIFVNTKPTLINPVNIIWFKYNTAAYSENFATDVSDVRITNV